MVKIIAIIGEAGSGKDYLAKKLVKAYPTLFHEIVSCTTRPKREKEIDGVDYHFLSENDFQRYVAKNKMLEISNFRGWYYGTLLNSLSSTKVNLGVFNPEGVRSLLQHSDDIQLTVFRLITTSKARLLRQLNREDDPDCDEIVRRYGTDKADFAHLDFEVINLKNEFFEDLSNNLQIISSCAQADWGNND